jgi:hypothetical protein
MITCGKIAHPGHKKLSTSRFLNRVCLPHRPAQHIISSPIRDMPGTTNCEIGPATQSHTVAAVAGRLPLSDAISFPLISRRSL